MEQKYCHNCTGTRSEIRALETFSTEQLAAEVDRRSRVSDRVPHYTHVEQYTEPEAMSPEFYNNKLTNMMKLSISAFTNRISLYREPENHNYYSDEINKIIINDCCTYQNRANDLLAHDKKLYAVLETPGHIDAFIRHKEKDLRNIEEYYSKKTVASIQVIEALRNNLAPRGLVARHCPRLN